MFLHAAYGASARLRRGSATLLVLAALSTGGVSAQEGAEDSAMLAAETQPLAAQSLLLDVTAVGDRFVAVGERGHVLLSEDLETWRQASSVPTRSTLTALTAIGDLVWAVGHDSVILHSSDGGDTWTRQYADPAQSGEDDPNPLFDVHFLDADRGLAAGSYGRLLVTGDGGRNWEEQLIGDLLSEEELDADADAGDDTSAADDYESQFGEEEQYYDYHLNGIAELQDGTLFLAGEAGTSYLSRDGGESWIFIAMPYEGSMFGVMATRDGRFVAYGLRGNVLESTDGGANWIEVSTDSLSSIMGGTVTDDGTEILVGANGAVLLRRPGGTTFVTYAFPGGEDLGNVTPVSGANLLVVGEGGIFRYTPGAGS
ncbi:MAG: hypothetical protein AAGE01_05990 [Pseudomonadota bacterium]